MEISMEELQKQFKIFDENFKPKIEGKSKEEAERIQDCYIGGNLAGDVQYAINVMKGTSLSSPLAAKAIATIKAATEELSDQENEALMNDFYSKYVVQMNKFALFQARHVFGDPDLKTSTEARARLQAVADKTMAVAENLLRVAEANCLAIARLEHYVKACKEHTDLADKMPDYNADLSGATASIGEVSANAQKAFCSNTTNKFLGFTDTKKKNVH